MKVLLACEESQAVTKEFRKLGHEAFSCDIEPCSGDHPEWHIKYDALEIMNGDCMFDTTLNELTTISGDWDMVIAFPPCTYICGSGWFRSVKDPERMKKSIKAIEFAKKLWSCSAKKICIENSIGKLSTVMEKPTQYIQPYDFGNDASKKTCLWLKNLPPLIVNKDDYIKPRIVITNGKEYKRWGNQTDSGQNRLGPSPDRGKIRSKTYTGIAKAMAEQWGGVAI